MQQKKPTGLEEDWSHSLSFRLKLLIGASVPAQKEAAKLLKGKEKIKMR
jgi:hypothetical protein